jgi:sulfotransferase
MKKIVFTSGLPRSGSTLLSSILNQNPRFHVDVSVPIRQIFDSVIGIICDLGNNSHCFDENLDDFLRSILDSFHKEEGVHFNHNRIWTGRSEILNRLDPNYKMIITVRDICWILDSFERLSRKNPYVKPLYVNAYANTDIYTRCEQYYYNVISHPYNCLKEILYSGNKNHMIIEYDVLVSNPEYTMKLIYEHIEEPYFQHDFNNIKNIPNSEIFDKELNMPGLHNVKKVVTPPNRQTILPPDIWEKYSGMEIWKNLKS